VEVETALVQVAFAFRETSAATQVWRFTAFQETCFACKSFAMMNTLDVLILVFW
jgi:hypothetical protein